MFISFLILIASVSLAQVRVSFTLNMAPRGLFPLLLHIDEEGVFVKDYYAHKGIDRLILDLRGNGGGDPFCASYLWAYLEPEALPYFEDHYGKYDTLANPVPAAPYP
mgnify:CR=1 FL=1